MTKKAVYKRWSPDKLRRLYAKHTAKELAKKYKVSVSTIRRALHYYEIYKRRVIPKHYVRREVFVVQNHLMQMSLYITYKSMIIDVTGSIIVNDEKYKEIKDKPQYMFTTLINHIHGPGSSGLITIIQQHEQEAQVGYSEEVTTQSVRGFRWDRFIINNVDYTAKKNDDMFKNSKKV